MFTKVNKGREGIVGEGRTSRRREHGKLKVAAEDEKKREKQND